MKLWIEPSYVQEAIGFEKRPPETTVYEPNSDRINTGLLDKDGNHLYRVSERNPIGFMAKIDDHK